MDRIRVADILEQGLPSYLVDRKLSWKQTKVVGKIINCCSPYSSRQRISCSNSNCDYTVERGTPCGDRHCNRCNNNKMLKWLSKIITQFLPLCYHHVVFTLPSELRNLIVCNKEVIYDLFFKSAFDVLKKFSKDEKYFGGEIGFIGLLHTWGQTLSYHPHLHFIVLSGGIKNGRYCRLPYSKNFLFPVNAMSKVMMGVFIEKLKFEYNNGNLLFAGNISKLSTKNAFNNFLYEISQKEWVVYNQAPLNGSPKVLEYLSRYTYKVAISNHRIKKYSDGRVTFEYKDYKDRNEKGVAQKKLMTLTEKEFIRRYLLHILPEGFRKLRYGGIFASNKKKESISIIKDFFKDIIETLNQQTEIWYNRVRKYIDVLCPKCEEKLLFNFYCINTS
ncbi:MAG: transposase [Ignavibacteriae bacterium]|nr:transposase [Ignavibacteriota bacterium]